MKHVKKLAYVEVSGVVQNTGWPIDGRRLFFGLWDYDNRSCYHLHSWGDEDDEAVKQTMFRTLVEAEFIGEEEKENFDKVWEDGDFEVIYSPGPFCIDLDKLKDVKEVGRDDRD